MSTGNNWSAYVTNSKVETSQKETLYYTVHKKLYKVRKQKPA